MPLRDILRFVVLAALFVTPFICLIVPSSMFFPFITGKNFTFRILVEIALGAWVLLMFIDAKYRPRFSWILAAAGLFLAVIALADFMGVNPYRSFWSNYERMEGLITHIHLFLYFIIAGSVFATDQMWKWFWRTSLAASLLIAFNAYGQLMGWGAVHQSSNRMDATLGNSTYLAIYALFHAFLAMFLFFRDREKHPRACFIYPVIALINIAVLYYTQTRGAFLGLVGGIFLALLLAALFDREHPERRKYAIGGVVGAALLIAAFIVWKDASWIQNNRTLGRIADISLTDTTTKSRFMIWNMSWEGWKERPILGWGQDNFLYVFAKHYNPKMYNQEPWFDRSHDVFFDWLIAGGALGLLAYLSLFAAALYYLWLIPLHGTPDPASRDLGFARLRSTSDGQARPRHLSVIESGILTGMLAGYFVHNIFVFDNLTSYLIFFGFLAYLHTLYAESAHAASGAEQPHKKAHKRKGEEEDLGAGDVAVAALIVIALTAGTVYLLNIRNIKANIALIDSIRPESIFVDGANGQKEIAIERVLALRLFGTGEAREQLAQLALQTADPRVPEEVRKRFFDLTVSEFEEDLANDPENVRTLSFMATIYARFGLYDKALQYFKKSIKLSPNRQQSYLDLVQLLSVMGNRGEAEEVARVAYLLEPVYPEAAVMYAITLIHQKKFADAEKILSAFAGDAIIYDNRIALAYGNSGRFDKVVELVNEKIAKGYAVGQDYFTLAGGYAGLEDNAKAAQAIERAMEVDAGLKEQGEAMLKQLRGEK